MDCFRPRSPLDQQIRDTHAEIELQKARGELGGEAEFSALLKAALRQLTR